MFQSIRRVLNFFVSGETAVAIRVTGRATLSLEELEHRDCPSVFVVNTLADDAGSYGTNSGGTGSQLLGSGGSGSSGSGSTPTLPNNSAVPIGSQGSGSGGASAIGGGAAVGPGSPVGSNSGVMTLRDAITDSNSTGTQSNEIVFAPGLNGTINLLSALPIITSSVDINVSVNQNQIILSRDATTGMFRELDVGIGAFVTIEDLTVTNGVASPSDPDGGGVYNSGNLVMTGCTITHCVASNGSGGAVFNALGALMYLNGDSIEYNVASSLGGGISNFGDLTVAGGLISNNSAEMGGGIYNFSGTLLINGADITSNAATEAGGGVYNTFGGTLTITTTNLGDSVSGNTSPSGGALYNAGDATLTDCVISTLNQGPIIANVNDGFIPNIVLTNCVDQFGDPFTFNS